MEDDASYEVEVSRQADPGDFDEQQLQRLVQLALQRHGRRTARLSIALVGDDTIADLNERYLQHVGPTDVLSFDLSDENRNELEAQIVVSVDTARRQAEQRGHPAERELLLYCLHGLMHLLDYRDDQPEEAARMHRAEDELLTEIGVGPVYGGDGP